MVNDVLNDVYKGCMLIGNRFKQKYMHGYTSEEIEDWSASVECSEIARLTYELMNTLNIGMEKALDVVTCLALDHGFRNTTDHAWDLYCRGFLAGEIIGMPTEENIKKAEKAELIWCGDFNGTYGYYQDVLEEMKGE